MLSLQQIESDLKDAMKTKNQIAVEVLRGLKTRIQNEQIAKLSVPIPQAGALAEKELSKDEIIGLIRSEIKKRKEAAQAFLDGGRQESADKETKEAEILAKYLPAQMSEEDLQKLINSVIEENTFTAKDFGKAMGALKARVGASADSGTLAKFLKEKLK